MEERIARRVAHDRETKTNSYGGMGMDGLAPAELADRMDELEYGRSHPEVYPRGRRVHHKY